jgi:hypothetical protein
MEGSPPVDQLATEDARRAAVIFATLGFAALPRVPVAMVPVFQALHQWLDSWRRIGGRVMANVGRVAGIAALTLLTVFPVLAPAEPLAFGEIAFGDELKLLLSKRPDGRCAENVAPLLYTACTVDLTWAEVPVQVQYTFSEVERQDRVLTGVILRFSQADAPRIREALTSEYQQEGRPIVEGNTGRITSHRWWSGLTTSATFWGAQVNVGSGEYSEVLEKQYRQWCERTRTICEP